MGKVPQAYYDFIIQHAPYIYVIDGNPDLSWGKATFAAAFAIDFLYEAYFSKQFENEKASIKNKIVSLADFILTQQLTDATKEGYGGFKSTETSTSYYSVDACRVIPALLKAYKLTGNSTYLDAAKLAGATYLYNMQHKPYALGVHDKYYGGFARAVDINDAWLQQMDIEALYGLIGLKMLIDYDPANKAKYEAMMTDAIEFLRFGFGELYLHYDPPPSGDGKWHRIGVNETEVYDDPVAYALLGVYDYEGWSLTSEKVYSFINTIRANAEHPAYNPAICWAGYIDVVTRFPASDYYDAVTSGILWRIRADYDKSSLAYSIKIIDKHQDEFMYWGVRFTDYSYVENKKAMATVCWLSLLHLNYEDPTTPFTKVLNTHGENVLLIPIREAADKVSYGEAVDIKALVTPARVEEVLIEPGYVINDYLTIHLFAPVRHHDKIRRKGVDYEVMDIQEFAYQSDTVYRKAMLRRLLGQ
jgi:hypothetical protein